MIKLQTQSNQQNQPGQPTQTSQAATSNTASALQQQLQQGQNNPTLIAQLQHPPTPAQPLNQPSPLAAGQVPPHMVTLNQANNQKERQTIWSGLLEWHEKQKGSISK
jgi:hypothetical protein